MDVNADLGSELGGEWNERFVRPMRFVERTIQFPLTVRDSGGSHDPQMAHVARGENVVSPINSVLEKKIAINKNMINS